MGYPLAKNATPTQDALLPIMCLQCGGSPGKVVSFHNNSVVLDLTIVQHGRLNSRSQLLTWPGLGQIVP
jgi:hypothetical protein